MTDNQNQVARVEQARAKVEQARANIATGGPVDALVPQNLEDAFRLSKALAASGNMVPDHFQQKPDAIMAAILRGAEIGLKPMQALSNIAVINGRASIWGDALPALMQRAGHSLDTVVTGEGMEMVATATLIRGDTKQRIVRTFSMKDAEKAGLLSKKGPWQSYPQRMCPMRARSWVCRDGAADAMMGLQVAEEVQDYAPAKDITPPTEKQASSFAARKAALQPAVEDAAPTTHDDASTAEDETSSTSRSRSTQSEKEEDGGEAAKGEAAPTDTDVERSEIFMEGAGDKLSGHPPTSCPPTYSDEERTEWNAGYDSVDGPIEETKETAE